MSWRAAGLFTGPTPRAMAIRNWTAIHSFYLAIVLVYIVLPLGARFDDALLGTTLQPYDPLLNAGILEWGYISLWAPERRIFDWLPGFPLSNTLAGTENLLGWQLFYTPLRWLGVGNVSAYNILILLSFIIAAMGAALLARRYGANYFGACMAGFVFAFAPFHMNHIVHIQTLAVCWSPFAVLFLDRLLESGRLRDAAGLVASVTFRGLSGVYFGVFLAIILPLYALLSIVVGRHRPQRRPLWLLAAAGLATVLLVSPIAIHYLRFSSDHGLDHPVGVVMRFSVALKDLFKAPGWMLVWGDTPLSRGARATAAFPGIVASVLGIVFLLSARKKELRPLALLLALSVVAAFIFSLGPVLKIRGDDYPSRIAEWVPLPGRLFALFSAVRIPMRIVLYSILFGSAMVGLGATQLTNRLRNRHARMATCVAVLLLIAAEYAPKRWFAGGSAIVPEPGAVSSAYVFLRDEPDAGAVVELPSTDVRGVRGAVMTRYMYASTWHRRRVVAYHGSVLPPPVDSLQAAADRLPDESARRMLAQAGVTRLVFHRVLVQPDSSERALARLRGAGYRALHEAPDAVTFQLVSPRDIGQPAPSR